MSEFKKGKIIDEGKTKNVCKVLESVSNDGFLTTNLVILNNKGFLTNNLVILQNKDDVTAFNNPAKTKQFKGKARISTTITCNIFELLKRAGIPLAFEKRFSNTEFLSKKCTPIKLEVIARRCVDKGSSYLRRNPGLVPPYRSHNLIVEFFLKTTHGKFINLQGSTVIDNLNCQKDEDDPLIINPESLIWELYHSKKPIGDPEANLNRTVKSDDVLPKGVTMQDMIKIVRQTFLCSEGAWNILGYRLMDFKIEFGVTQAGQLVVIDVIDNDSHRLTDQNGVDYSKECFRQGLPLKEVKRRYLIVEALSKQIRIPQQALVFWRGSDSDKKPSIPDDLAGIHVIEVVLSAHKSPMKCIKKIEELMRAYPDGGVIITKAGRSNGLGPLLAPRTIWPILTIPATLAEFPNDIWSSVRMPSSDPLLVSWPDTNAVLAALNILAQKNPVAYMYRQYAIEQLDDSM